MSAGRIALFAAGLLIAAGALFLVVRGFRGAAAGPAAAAPEAAAPGAHGGKGEEKAPPPRWQSFLRPDERAIPPRPLVHLAQGLPNPFARRPGPVAPPSNTGVRRADPGFRLEGISVGARTMALISGHAVREGDALAGYRIVRIGRSAVTLAGPQGDRLNLTLKGAAG
jgi:hypothetical protein